MPSRDRVVHAAWLVLLACVLALVPASLEAKSAASDGLSCSPEARPGRIECVDAEGEVHWKRVHPSLWGEEWHTETDASFRERTDASRTPEVAVVDARLFYAVGPDVLEVEPETGTTLERTRFPAPVAGLEGDDEGKLQIDLEVEETIEVPAPERAGRLPMTSERSLRSETFQLQRSPGALDSPPQTFWTLRQRFASMKDAERLVRRTVPDFPDVDEMSAARAETLVARLERARERDPTNPFYSELIGRIHRIRGETEAARRAFERAAATEGAVREDLIRLSGRLAKAKAPEAAETAYQRGLAKMKAAGVDPERIQSLLVTAGTLMWPSGSEHPVHRAIAEEKPEHAHRLSLRLARLAPFVEGGAPSWFALADWFDRQGRAELADEWRTRARDNRQMREDYLRDVLGELDYLMLAAAASLAALVLLCFVAGVRGGEARRRTRDETSSSDDGQRTSFLHVRGRDLFGIALMLALVGTLSYTLQVRFDFVAKNLLSVPNEIAGDSLAAPQVEAWLDALADSPAEQQLRDIALSEQHALATGESFPTRDESDPPVVRLLVDAMHADAETRPWRRLHHGESPFYLPRFQSDPVSGGLGADPMPIGAMHLFALLVLLGGALVGGAALGYVLPNVGKWGLRFVPGGTPNVAPFGGLLMAACAAGGLALLGLGTVLHRTALPTFHGHFGVSSIASAPEAPSLVWLWLSVGLAVVVHSAAVYADLDRAE